MPTYNIGLDFGTTNSIIAYFNNGNLEAFKYGTPGNQEEYIPSFIAYEDGLIEIGSAARSAAYQPNTESYGNFKMKLPLPESDFDKHFYNNHTPINVTADYLRELLLSPENPYSFSREKGEISAIVVSVPEIWQRDIYNLGRERLQKLIQEDLGLGEKLIQLVSEPVAAAAYYAWEVQRNSQQNKTEPFTGNLLVCDMGGGTFDVSLCRIYGDKKVEVLYFDGEGDKGLDSAGVAFDRRCVQTAYIKKYEEPINEKDPKFNRLLKDFETVKLSKHRATTQKLTNYLKAQDVLSEQQLYIFADDYLLTCGDISKAFTPIAEGIRRVLQRVQDWLKNNNQEINRLFLVGGFSQFYLVQKTIVETLEIDENDSRLDRSFNLTNSAYAISYGACLIANGLVYPTEKYVHTLGIVINKEIQKATIRGIQFDIIEEYLMLIKGGLSLDELSQIQFYEQPLVSWQESFSVPIWVAPQSKGKRYQKYTDPVQLPNYSSSAQYRVGMYVNKSQIAYLIIEEIQSKVTVKYELGNVINMLFPGFIQADE
jgi:molecular chaperone DnaK